MVAALPNEVWALVGERVWPTRQLLELSWTCRLLRSCVLSNYVAALRYGGNDFSDWRHHYRQALLEDEKWVNGGFMRI